jgi:hypothetical protein
MLRITAASIVAFVVAAVLWVSQCSGPKPSVVGQPRVMAPEQPGDPYRVEGTIRNDGPGHGEVRVTFRLVDKSSGEAYQKDDELQLEGRQTARAVVDMPAPPGDYAAEIEAQYPPR